MDDGGAYLGSGSAAPQVRASLGSPDQAAAGAPLGKVVKGTTSGRDHRAFERCPERSGARRAGSEGSNARRPRTEAETRDRGYFSSLVHSSLRQRLPATTHQHGPVVSATGRMIEASWRSSYRKREHFPVTFKALQPLLAGVCTQVWQTRDVPNENQHGRHPPVEFEHTSAVTILWLPDAVPVCVTSVPFTKTVVLHVMLPAGRWS
jgi:hypothetical protein